mgnify:CR=1 FL=1
MGWSDMESLKVDMELKLRKNKNNSNDNSNNNNYMIKYNILFIARVKKQN